MQRTRMYSQFFETNESFHMEWKKKKPSGKNHKIFQLDKNVPLGICEAKSCGRKQQHIITHNKSWKMSARGLGAREA